MNNLFLVAQTLRKITAAANYLHVEAFTLLPGELKAISNPLDVRKEAVLKSKFPDALRRKYWDTFPRYILKARRLKSSKRHHPVGGVILTRPEFFQLFKEFRKLHRKLRALSFTTEPDVAMPSMWQKWLKIKPTPEQAQKAQIKRLKQDIRVFDKFMEDMQLLLGKRGIYSYLISWS